MERASFESRRRFLNASAWAVPVAGVAVAAPIAAASTEGTLGVQLLTTGLGGGGFDFRLNDGKNLNSSTSNLPRALTRVAFQLFDTSSNAIVRDAAVSVFGDEAREAEGNYVIAVWRGDETGVSFGESPVKRTANRTTNASGEFHVRLATATFSLVDCVRGSVPPKNGVLTVTAEAEGFQPLIHQFTYQVYDGETSLNGIVPCRLA